MSDGHFQRMIYPSNIMSWPGTHLQMVPVPVHFWEISVGTLFL